MVSANKFIAFHLRRKLQYVLCMFMQMLQSVKSEKIKLINKIPVLAAAWVGLHGLKAKLGVDKPQDQRQAFKIYGHKKQKKEVWPHPIPCIVHNFAGIEMECRDPIENSIWCVIHNYAWKNYIIIRAIALIFFLGWEVQHEPLQLAVNFHGGIAFHMVVTSWIMHRTSIYSFAPL